MCTCIKGYIGDGRNCTGELCCELLMCFQVLKERKRIIRKIFACTLKVHHNHYNELKEQLRRLGLLLLTLGAHAARVTVVVLSVCVCVCQRLFWHYKLRGGPLTIPAASVLHEPEN